MPRSNRPRGHRPGADGDDESDLSSLLAGWRRTEAKRDGQWHVQPVPAAQALKNYVCPGCRLQVAQGTAHVVAWRGDGVLGDEADIAARRHWHAHCWKIK